MGEQIRYISLFSGVEACSVAWYHMDNWLPQVFAEFDEFPSAVLKHQFPHVPNVGDVTKHEWKQYKGQIELIVGGSPCQSFSVAGKRLGLDDPRGNLALHFLRIVEEIRPTWFLFENVPGLLSSDNGRDFAAFLRQVEDIGYGCAYRILDAQYFGVPQRRRRVFVVGHIDGDWRRAAAVLFEPEGLSGNPPTREKARKEAAANAGRSTTTGGWNRGRGIGEEPTGALTAEMYHHGGIPNQTAFDANAHIIPEVSDTVAAKWEKGADVQLGSQSGGNIIPVGVDLFNQEETDDVQKSAIPIHDKATRYQGGGPDRKDDGAGNGFGVGKEGDPLPTLDTKCNHAVFQQQGVDLFNQELTGDLHCPLRTAQGHGAPAVMFENHGMDSRVKEVDVAPTIPARAGTGGNNLPIIAQPHKDICFDHTFGQNAVVYEDVAPTLKANGLVPTSPAVLGMDLSQKAEGIGLGVEVANTVAPGTHPGHGNHVAIPIQGQAVKEEGGVGLGVGDQADPSYTLTKNDQHAVAVIDRAAFNQGENAAYDPHIKEEETMPTLVARGPHATFSQLAVRRLTPVECERLQGFPDNWTQIPWKGKPKERCPDGPRFKCMGNSMAVPVMRWIGEGIEMVNRIPRTEAPQQDELGWL